MHWFLWSQPDHEERPLPTSAYHWSVGHSLESPHVYQDWSPTHIPPHLHCWRWQIKHRLLDPLWILWVVCNSLWLHQCTCGFPTLHEQHLCWPPRCLHNSSTTTLTLSFLWPTWPRKELHGSSPMAAGMLSMLLKRHLHCTPVITHWVLDVQITVKTDASDYTVATVLSITVSDREIHPVAFYSQTLTTSKLNYDTYDRSSLPFMSHSGLGDTILRAPQLQLMLLLITKT